MYSLPQAPKQIHEYKKERRTESLQQSINNISIVLPTGAKTNTQIHIDRHALRKTTKNT